MSFKFSNDLDIDLQLEKTVKRNVATRIRLVALFTIFLFVILALIKNGYSLTFGKENNYVFSCGPKNTQDLTNDDMETRSEKATKAILANQETLDSLVGFKEAYASKEPRGYKKRDVVVIKIIFSEDSPEHQRIPEQICGFDIDLLYK